MRQRSLARALLIALAFLPSAAVGGETATIGRGEDSGLLFIQALDQRVANISWKITSANAALCSEHANAVGISLHNAAQYAPKFRQSAIDTFGFGDGLPTILAVAAESPGRQAGLRVGDRIISIDGEAILPTRLPAGAREDYAPIAAVMARLEAQLDRPILFEILRDNDTRTIRINPNPACRSRVEVVPSGETNANSNGTVVQINGKLAIWAKADDELATVIAHEMAHNILGHNARIERERIGTGLSAVFGASGRKLREMEREADRYGLYLVARAGYDYHAAPDLWRRLTNASGLGSVWATTHPTARDREAFNKAVVAEIERKKAAGEPLMP